MTTPYHAKYFAYELTRQGGAGIERLSRSLFDASVDLNPHQVEAALFAMRSPLSSGALLADEVGLGKTIEAGIVLCECWAERRRRLLGDLAAAKLGAGAAGRTAGPVSGLPGTDHCPSTLAGPRGPGAHPIARRPGASANARSRCRA